MSDITKIKQEFDKKVAEIKGFQLSITLRAT
uniref:Uncharacterized protein n=1 Tax=Borrelia garinii subsp. bavariensis (strain ATCC BAA-2496 / DSM 23469 / PBi) TaxID=290434 RepID=A0A7M4BKV4_BORGP|nr:hypothetical protein BGP150 [Borreliella bavariensis PBi]